MSKDKSIGETVESLIKESNTIAIIPPKVAGVDAFCAGAGLFHMLKDIGKHVSLVYPGKVPKETENLINEEDITKSVKSRSLYVSIDYSGTEAAKVHYSTEDDILHLRISPIPVEFDKDSRVFATISGFEFDLIISVGAQVLEDLGSSYENLDTNSKMSKIVNIDNSEKNERFGYANVIDNDSNSLSLMVLQKSTTWGLKPNDKAAKSLLKGIEARDFPHRS